MKKCILIFALLVGSYSHAFINLPVNSSKVEADLICQNPGGGFGIAWPQENQPARIWQVDSQVEEGLELEVTDFRVARCPGCFAFEASLLGMKLEGQASNFNLQVFGENADGQKEKLLDAVCVPSKK